MPNFRQFYPLTAQVCINPKAVAPDRLVFPAKCMLNPGEWNPFAGETLGGTGEQKAEICIPCSEWTAIQKPERGQSILINGVEWSVSEWTADGFHFVLKCIQREIPVCP